MEKGKKVLLGLGTVAAAALPLAAVVSCSEKVFEPKINDFHIEVVGTEATITVQGLNFRDTVVKN